MSNAKIFWLVLFVLVASAGVWYFTRMTKEKAIQVILNAKSGRSESSLSTLGKDYLIKWAKAIKSGKATFELDGKTYKTDTGTSI